MNVTAIIIAALVVGAVGIILGFFLGISGEKFKVEVDPREEAILEVLPGNNCGGCGYAGCSGLAAAIVKGEAPVGQCPVGGDPVAAKVSEGHITVSPSPTSNNFTARCSAAVPALSALQCAIPVYASISRSKPLTFGPSGAIQLVSNASCTNFCSSPCIVGDAIYIRSFMLSHPPVILSVDLSVYMYTLELIFLQLHEYSDLRKMPHDLIQRSVH